MGESSPLTIGLLISMIGVIIVVGTHIAVIARWSGKIDGFFLAIQERITRDELEIEKLRSARHAQDGIIAFHNGVLMQAFPDLDRRQGNPITSKIA